MAIPPHSRNENGTTRNGSGLRVRRKTRLMGLMGLGDAPPRITEDVEQNVFLDSVPSKCKCGSAAIVFQAEVGQRGVPRRASCFTCGRDWFLVMATDAAIQPDPVKEVGFESRGSKAKVVPLRRRRRIES